MGKSQGMGRGAGRSGMRRGQPGKRKQVGQKGVAETTVSLADLQAPKKARKLYEKSTKQLSEGEFTKAEESLRQALEIYPEYPSAWHRVGRLLQRKGDAAEAKVAHQNAVSADPKAWRAYRSLAEIAVVEQDWTRMEKASEQALATMPMPTPQLYVYNAVALYMLDRLGEAEVSALNAVQKAGDWRMPKAYHVLGLIQVERKDYAAAVKNLETYLNLAPSARDAEIVRQQLSLVRSRHGDGLTSSAAESIPRHSRGL